MDLGIEGKTALVMGASRGIGRAIAAVLAQEGVKVAMASRSRERLEEAAKEIEGETAVFEADTSDLDWMAALPDEVASKLGPVDILVTNTGGPPLGARPGGHPRAHRGGPAARRRARPRARRVAGRVRLAGARSANARRGGASRDARAQMGPDRERGLAR